MTVVAFDLDGTLSDPAVGITSSINHALQSLGVPQRDPDSLIPYIGPPLNEIFADLLQTVELPLIDSAIAFYRERYVTIGYRENVLYAGIKAVLERLMRSGYPLYIATSKRTDIAESVIEYLDLQQYFVQVLGCGLHREKYELLQEIIEREGDQSLYVIGDRIHDISAGHRVGANCIGVLWGYGSEAELKDAHAIIQNPQQILDILT